MLLGLGFVGKRKAPKVSGHALKLTQVMHKHHMECKPVTRPPGAQLISQRSCHMEVRADFSANQHQLLKPHAIRFAASSFGTLLRRSSGSSLRIRRLL